MKRIFLLALLTTFVLSPLPDACGDEIVVACGEDLEPIVMPFGASTTCSISPASDSDLFTVIVPAGPARMVRLTIRSTSNNADPLVEIFGPDGFSDSFACSASTFSTCSASKLIELAPGTYTVLCSEGQADQTMGYQFGVEAYPPDAAPDLPYGASSGFTISPAVDYDWFRIPDVAAGALIRVTVSSSSNNADPRLEIVGADGAIHAADGCDASTFSTCSFQTNWTAPASGDYWIGLHEGAWDQNMAGSVSVQCLVGCGPAPSCPADLDGDGVVDAADLALLLVLWGPVGGLPGADLNDDGVIDAADLSTLLAAWGSCA